MLAQAVRIRAIGKPVFEKAVQQMENLTETQPFLLAADGCLPQFSSVGRLPNKFSNNGNMKVFLAGSFSLQTEHLLFDRHCTRSLANMLPFNQICSCESLIFIKCLFMERTCIGSSHSQCQMRFSPLHHRNGFLSVFPPVLIVIVFTVFSFCFSKWRKSAT